MVIQLRESGPPLADDDLSDLERRLGIALPAEYRAFLLAHNGGVSRAPWFRLPIRDEWIAAPSIGRGDEVVRLQLQQLADGRAVERLAPGRPVSRRRSQCGCVRPRTRVLRTASRAAGGTRGRGPGCVISDQRLALHRHHGRWARPGAVRYWPDVTPAGGEVLPVRVAPSLAALCEMLRPLGDKPPDWLSLVQDGDLEEVRRWVEHNGRRLREKDDREWSALDYAVFEKRWEIARFLMEKRDASPEMVFFDAMNDGRFSTALGMLHFGVDRECLEPSLARKAAEFWADLDLVRAFIDAGANVDHVDNDKSPGNTPLHFAAHVGAVEAVRLLLERGADPTVNNDERHLPQDLASHAGYIDLAVLLDQAVMARPAPADPAREPEAVDLHKVAMGDALPGLSEDALKELEQRLGTRLPGEYRVFLKRFNGGVPRPARFGFRNDDDDEGAVRCAVTRFLAVGGAPTSLGEHVDLEAAHERLADWDIPKRLLPIAAAEDEYSGGVLCISLRTKDRGRIVYYPQNDSTDSTTYRVAKSLSAFFGLLNKAKRKMPEWVNAIEDGDLDELQRWLDGGGKLTTRHRGRTPLEVAVEKGRTDVVRALIAAVSRRKRPSCRPCRRGRTRSCSTCWATMTFGDLSRSTCSVYSSSRPECGAMRS